MKTIFTIHAGEYLTATEIEKRFPNYNVWLPGKDTGIDLLLTDKTKNNKKVCSVQVKFSKSFTEIGYDKTFGDKLKTTGWWTFDRDKILHSPADFWIFALHSFETSKRDYIIITPGELIDIYNQTERKNKKIHSYIWITNENKAFETRNLNRSQQKAMFSGTMDKDIRNMTRYLNCWERLK